MKENIFQTAISAIKQIKQNILGKNDWDKTEVEGRLL